MLIHTRSLVNQLESCLFSIPCMDLSQLSLGLEERKWPIKDQEKMTTWKTLYYSPSSLLQNWPQKKTNVPDKRPLLIFNSNSQHNKKKGPKRSQIHGKRRKNSRPVQRPAILKSFSRREASSWCSLPRAKAQRWHHGCNAQIELTDCADHVNTYVSSLVFFSQQ